MPALRLPSTVLGLLEHRKPQSSRGVSEHASAVVPQDVVSEANENGQTHIDDDLRLPKMASLVIILVANVLLQVRLDCQDLNV